MAVIDLSLQRRQPCVCPLINHGTGPMTIWILYKKASYYIKLKRQRQNVKYLLNKKCLATFTDNKGVFSYLHTTPQSSFSIVV